MLKYLRHLLPENSRQYREETSQRIAWGHWFTLFNVVLALMIASRYAFSADWPNTLFGKLYFFISTFGHFSFIVFAFYLLLLFPLSFILKNHRGFRGFAVIYATLGQTLLLLDTEVFNRFYLHLSPLVWDLLVNPDNGELARQWQLLFVPMPLILLAEMLYSRWCWQKLRSFNRQKWGKYVATFFVCCFIATHLLYAWADMAQYRPITAQKANYPLSYPMTARTFLSKHGLIDPNDYQQNGRLDSFYLDYPKSTLRFNQPANTPNLLIINISGLRNDVISPQNTPNLAAVSQQARRFNHHYIGGNTKTAGIASLFYSLSGCYIDGILNEKIASPLIRMLQKQGYQFGLFSHNGFNQPIYQKALFADFKLPKAKGNLSAISQWKNWIIQQKQPFFSYLDLSIDPNKDYQQQLNIVDLQFSLIWQQFEQQNLTANTLMVITSDIAQPLNQEALTNPFSHEITQVPMLVYWQGQMGDYQALSSHLDFLPTVLSQFFGSQTPIQDYAQGIDLSSANERKWLLMSDYKWNVAILPDGEQYHLDKKGHFTKFDAFDRKESNVSRPPLALFLQLIQQSNQFVEK